MVLLWASVVEVPVWEGPSSGFDLQNLVLRGGRDWIRHFIGVGDRFFRCDDFRDGISQHDRVVPAISETIARSSLSKALSNVDFPAFGRPAITVLIPFLITLPSRNDSIKA